jgi:hypothetical protein
MISYCEDDKMPIMIPTDVVIATPIGEPMANGDPSPNA